MSIIGGTSRALLSERWPRLPGRLTGRKNRKRFVPLSPNQSGEFQVDRVELQQFAGD